MEKHEPDPILDPILWRKIAVTLGINIFSVALVFTALDISGYLPSSTAMLEKFKKSHSVFFLPIQQIGKMILDGALAPALVEEFVFRGPIKLLLALMTLSPRPIAGIAKPCVWILGVGLTFCWAFFAHQSHGVLWLTVFTAGLAWLWLVIETCRLWPAMVCHFTANLSIYFILKLLP